MTQATGKAATSRMAAKKTPAKKKQAKKKAVKRAVKRPAKKAAPRTPAKAGAAGTATGTAVRSAAGTAVRTEVPPAQAPTTGAAVKEPEAPKGSASRDVSGEFWGEEDRDEAPSRRGRRALRQHHIVRNVSVWSVLKVSVIFYLCAWMVVLIAGVVLWRLSDQAGLIGNVESFWAEATGQETVEWDGSKLFRSWLMAGSVLALASAAVTTLLAALFNLICDLTGGIRYTVLEVETHSRRTRRGRRAGS